MLHLKVCIFLDFTHIRVGNFSVFDFDFAVVWISSWTGSIFIFLDQEAVLDNVLYSRAYTSEQQMELLDFVCAKFHEEPGIFKLLIVDSVMALFRVDFSGRGELAERQQNLAQMMSKLQKISEEYNVAVLVTNQMTSDPGKMGL